MILIPFEPRFSEHVVCYYNASEYSHWARGIERYLTVEECSRLPQIFCSEFLHISKEDDLCGLIKLQEQSPGIYLFGIVVRKDFQKKGIADEAVKMTEDYVRDKKRGNVIMAYVVDDFIGAHWSKSGWVKSGEIPGDYVDGEYKNLQVYYKKLRNI